MTERLLQFIWQFQYYNREGLKTTAGESIEILQAGILNRDQGPDFQQARIKINNITWAGDVELHLQSTQWFLHRHHTDERYSQIILHVVFRNDKLILDKEGNIIPTLELADRIPVLLLQRYHHWMNLPATIPCRSEIHTVPKLVWDSWLQRLVIERLQQKAMHILQLLQKNGNHWEQVCWQLTCRAFAGPVNAESFEQIAGSLPINLLAKHKPLLHQLEALLLGQAGLLQASFQEQYPLMLQKEYQFLQTKYQLQPITRTPVFLRMRPVNFPTLRLAQLAMLIHQSTHLFSKIKESNTVKEIHSFFTITASAFWNTHFRLTESSVHQVKKTGNRLIDSIVINMVVPLLFTYAQQAGETKYMNRALSLLEELRAEQNSTTNLFTQLQLENPNAFSSQALLQLKTHYCEHLKCLECAAGNAILKRL